MPGTVRDAKMSSLRILLARISWFSGKDIPMYPFNHVSIFSELSRGMARYVMHCSMLSPVIDA